MQQRAAIQIEEASVVFPTHAGSVPAFHAISLAVQAGQFVAIVGPSGCGKSTLLRLVGGLLAPSSGRVLVGGRTPEEARRDHLVSFVFQQPVLLPWYTALQNVELPLRLFGWPAQQRQETASRFLDMVGVGQFARAYPQQLSGGMQQRVALARALAFEPAVLLMDEPFGALDEITRERLNGELLQLWAATGATVLFVTHSLTEAVFLADRVIVLSAHPGRLIADIPVGLPHPRTSALLTQPAFVEIVASLRQQLNRGYGLHRDV